MERKKEKCAVKRGNALMIMSAKTSVVHLGEEGDCQMGKRVAAGMRRDEGGPHVNVSNCTHACMKTRTTGRGNEGGDGDGGGRDGDGVVLSPNNQYHLHMILLSFVACLLLLLPKKL